MDDQMNQIQHPVLKIESPSGQYGTPVINTGMSGVNQVYYVVMPNIPDQGNIITSGTNSLLQNQNAYYVINPGNTTWNQLPVIQTSTAPSYVDPNVSEVPMQQIHDSLQTVAYGAPEINSIDMMQGINDFATEVVINTEPEPEQSYDSSQGSQTPKLTKPSCACDVCHKILCNKDSLRRHKKLVHGQDDSGLSESPVEAQKRNAKQCECEFCGKVLCNKDSLRRHQKVVHKLGSSQGGGGGHQYHPTQPPYINLGPGPVKSEQELLEEAVRRLDEISGQDQSGQHGHHPQQVYYHVNSIQQQQHQHQQQPHHKISQTGTATTKTKTTRRFAPKARRKKHPLCEVCNKPFYNKATLLRHWSTFHKGMKMGEIKTTSVEVSSNVTCELCNRTFFDFATLRRHKIVVHRDNSHSTMNSVRGGRGHQQQSSNSNPNVKSDPCHICGKVLYDKGVLRRHLKMVHKISDAESQRLAQRKFAGTSPKAQKCHLCDKILYDRGVLRRHLKYVHHVGANEPLPRGGSQVNVSSSSTTTPRPPTTKTYSRTPIKVEMDRPPPVIPGLDTPVIEDPTKSNNSAHACGKCEETFANSSNLKRHLVIVHKMQLDNYESVLRQHTIHSKMPRECNICGKTIIGRSNLARHQQNVHKIGVGAKADGSSGASVGNNSTAQQNDNNHTPLEENYMLKCEPEEVETYSTTEQQQKQQVDHNSASHPAELGTEATIITDPTAAAISGNGHHPMELGSEGAEVVKEEEIAGGIGNEVVFELNEVEECVAKIKEEVEKVEIITNNEAAAAAQPAAAASTTTATSTTTSTTTTNSLEQ